MTGVSIGWFDNTLLWPDIDRFARQVRKKLRFESRSFPLSVSSITRQGFGIGISYCHVGGHIPIHIDTKSPHDANSDIWQFIVWTENRPVLYAAKQNEQIDAQMLEQTDVRMAFSMGAIELIAGRAIHLPIDTHWHGVGSLPQVGRSATADHTPRAVIMQVSGYGADQIGEALDYMTPMITADRSFWDDGFRQRDATADRKEFGK